MGVVHGDPVESSFEHSLDFLIFGAFLACHKVIASGFEILDQPIPPVRRFPVRLIMFAEFLDNITAIVSHPITHKHNIVQHLLVFLLLGTSGE